MSWNYLQQKIHLFGIVILTILITSSCFRCKYEINYEFGEFPDSVINLEAVNTIYDDYNSAAPATINIQIPLIFSSNRYTKGGKYDLVDYNLYIFFDKTDGSIDIQSYINPYPYYYLTDLANSDANEFGPINAPFASDEFLFCFSSDRTGNMEIYTTYWTSGTFNGMSPIDPAPFRISGVNSPFYDAYPSFTQDFSKMIFCSNRDGNLDLYTVEMPRAQEIVNWLKLQDTTFTATPVVELNSPEEDVCPLINGKLIVFSSKRDGGYGGYDLWYATVREDGFGEPVNFGPKINTEYDEYRPIVMYAQLFDNDLMIFSSNRPGGKGGFDLYYTGIPRMTLQD
ncbi:MAG: PD40 domain-containing protein [Bacteroidales bacterium]|nr:PD40 domain-containing protein [Bacteroidales bacterium]